MNPQTAAGQPESCGAGRSPVFLVGHGVMQPAFMARQSDSLAGRVAAGYPVDPDAEPPTSGPAVFSFL